MIFLKVFIYSSDYENEGTSEPFNSDSIVLSSGSNYSSKGTRMTIGKVKPFTGGPVKGPQEVNQQAGEEKAALERELLYPPDRLQLSSSFQEVARAKRMIMDQGDIRTEEVSRLRNEIAQGSYTIDPEIIAAGMLESHLFGLSGLTT